MHVCDSVCVHACVCDSVYACACVCDSACVWGGVLQHLPLSSGLFSSCSPDSMCSRRSSVQDSWSLMLQVTEICYEYHLRTWL